jgi:hypothetical protein
VRVRLAPAGAGNFFPATGRSFAASISSAMPTSIKVPFPPCGGRLGWGVMQRCGFDVLRSIERARLSPRHPPSSYA